MDEILKLLWELLSSAGMQLVGVLLLGLCAGFWFSQYLHKGNIATAEKQANTNKIQSDGVKIVHDSLAARYEFDSKRQEQLNQKLRESEDSISAYKSRLRLELELKDKAINELMGLYKFAFFVTPYLKDEQLENVLGNFIAEDRNPLLEAEVWKLKADIRRIEKSHGTTGLLGGKIDFDTKKDGDD